MTVCALCLGVQRYFSIRTVAVIGDTVTPAVRGYDVLYNQFLPFVDTDAIISSLSDQNPQIATISIEKQYPDAVEIRYLRSVPSAALVSSGTSYVLSDSGRVLSISSVAPPGVPQLTHYQQFYRGQVKIGDVIETKDIQLSLKMVDVLESLGFTVKEVAIESFYMIRLVLSDTREIYISTEKNFDKQEYQIREILKKFKIDGTRFRSLDVRFDKPVIKQ